MIHEVDEPPLGVPGELHFDDEEEEVEDEGEDGEDGPTSPPPVPLWLDHLE